MAQSLARTAGYRSPTLTKAMRNSPCRASQFVNAAHIIGTATHHYPMVDIDRKSLDRCDAVTVCDSLNNLILEN